MLVQSLIQDYKKTLRLYILHEFTCYLSLLVHFKRLLLLYISLVMHNVEAPGNCMARWPLAILIGPQCVNKNAEWSRFKCSEVLGSAGVTADFDYVQQRPSWNQNHDYVLALPLSAGTMEWLMPPSAGPVVARACHDCENAHAASFVYGFVPCAKMILSNCQFLTIKSTHARRAATDPWECTRIVL